MSKIYDTLIIGGGPAGLSAALYASRSKMSTLVFEKARMGGQIVITADVANYPGSVCKEGAEHPTGPEIVARMVQQAEDFGAQRVMKEIKKVNLSDKIKTIETADGEIYQGKSIILATGAVPRKLGCIGEKEFTGKGVSYCATCDADFFTDFEVFVVGGGDSAVEEAIYLADFARKVTLVVRKPFFRCAKSIEEKALANPKIEVKYNTELLEVKGDGIAESAIFKNNVTGEEYEYFAPEEDGTFGIFMFVGFDANTNLFKDVITVDNSNFVITNDNMETNIPGVFAAGDLRVKSLRQVVTATADGAIAATIAYKYIKEEFEK
ncbi:FAD-dependent oxidoreductase [uncultured Cetobacterium sp.]|uniref:FAD-dependent oxidoreductase n=1 Tax=uncultured Cetobacterium sp. TaxID=527638 RepID=UPI0026197AF8|nr:FAD-dependent oxidoreductase [uncultured Cetobacterium sp.]